MTEPADLTAAYAKRLADHHRDRPLWWRPAQAGHDAATAAALAAIAREHDWLD